VYQSVAKMSAIALVTGIAVEKKLLVGAARSTH